MMAIAKNKEESTNVSKERAACGFVVPLLALKSSLLFITGMGHSTTDTVLFFVRVLAKEYVLDHVKSSEATSFVYLLMP